MKCKSIVTMAFLIIPFFIISSISAEIFELVNDYDITASDIEAGDFNNDGLEDFAVTDWIVDSSYYEVFLSNGDCSFTRSGPVYVDTSHVRQLLTGDFIEDSNEDLLMMNLEETWLYMGDGSGSFVFDDKFPWSLYNGCTGDINNDGHLDIVGISLDFWPWGGDSVVVMLGDGTGGFAEGWVYDEDPPSFTDCFVSSQLAYFDNPDTILDLCVPCGDGGSLIFQGNGDGSFSAPDHYGAEIMGWSGPFFSSCGDFDEDGYIDIALAGSGSMSCASAYIYINQHDGTFEILPEGYFIGQSCSEKMATADLDLDGYLDISAQGCGSLAGFGDGTFGEYLSNGPGIDFVLMDMDSDGDLDLSDRHGQIGMNITITQGCEEESTGSQTDAQ